MTLNRSISVKFVFLIFFSNLIFSCATKPKSFEEKERETFIIDKNAVLEQYYSRNFVDAQVLLNSMNNKYTLEDNKRAVAKLQEMLQENLREGIKPKNKIVKKPRSKSVKETPIAGAVDFNPGPMPEISPYGKVYAVMKYIEDNANDPSSIEYVNWGKPEVYKTDKYAMWQVNVSYRGKNAFGALVLNSSTFFIKNNQIIAQK